MVRKDYTIEITSDKITKDYAYVDDKSLESMVLYKFKRYTAVVERIRHTVGKSADNEQRNCEKERNIMLSACECHSSSHHETARDAEKTATYRTSLESESENILRSSLDVKRRHSGDKAHDEASDNVSTEDDEKLSKLILLEETCCTCI